MTRLEAILEQMQQPETTLAESDKRIIYSS